MRTHFHGVAPVLDDVAAFANPDDNPPVVIARSDSDEAISLRTAVFCVRHAIATSLSLLAMTIARDHRLIARHPSP
jgi:hypothetical protein